VRPERLLASVAVRCAALGAVVLLAAVPVYVYVEPPWRPPVARLAAALVLGAGLLRLRAEVAAGLTRRPSALDAARDRREAPPAVPLRFEELIEDLRASRRSRRHFERILWPRLSALAAHPLTPPPTRRGRGPGLAALREVIAAIERQR
jgi:hypothetical protein